MNTPSQMSLEKAREIIRACRWPDGILPETQKLLVNMTAAVIDEQIEACAEVAETHPTAAMIRMSTGESIAVSIRRLKN